MLISALARPCVGNALAQPCQPVVDLAPPFFTGHLIARFGAHKIRLAGVLMFAGCVGVNLSGTAIWQFWSALILLGLGWNCLYIGGSTLLTEAYLGGSGPRLRRSTISGVRHGHHCFFRLTRAALHLRLERGQSGGHRAGRPGLRGHRLALAAPPPGSRLNRSRGLTNWLRRSGDSRMFPPHFAAPDAVGVAVSREMDG